jgi:hypothetical protein
MCRRLKIGIKAMFTDPFSSFAEYTAGNMRQGYQNFKFEYITKFLQNMYSIMVNIIGTYSIV